MDTWYALYTKPNQENLVLNQLEQRGVEAFFPQFVERRRAGDRVRALFPTYLFVRVDLEVVGRSLLQWTPGLRGVVSFAGVPARVPEEAIALVRKQLA
jgi:transcription antitermination factor NusG